MRASRRLWRRARALERWRVERRVFDVVRKRRLQTAGMSAATIARIVTNSLVFRLNAASVAAL